VFFYEKEKKKEKERCQQRDTPIEKLPRKKKRLDDCYSSRTKCFALSSPPLDMEGKQTPRHQTIPILSFGTTISNVGASGVISVEPYLCFLSDVFRIFFVYCGNGIIDSGTHGVLFLLPK
jgi:hypothetical protein